MILIALLIASPGFAAEGSCRNQAKGLKLTGPSLASYMDRCEREAGIRCGRQADEQGLSRTKTTAYTKRCLAEAVGE